MLDCDRDEKRLVVTTEKSIRKSMADEQMDDRLNLAVPSLLFSDMDPIILHSILVVSRSAKIQL